MSNQEKGKGSVVSPIRNICQKVWAFIIIASVPLVLLLAALFLFVVTQGVGGIGGDAPLIPALVVSALVVLSVLFVWLFTGDPEACRNRSRGAKHDLRNMVRFSYAFTLLVIGLPLLPFMVSSGNVPAMNAGAFSVLEACAVHAEKNPAAESIRCVELPGADGEKAGAGDYPQYWLVNIGGTTHTNTIGKVEITGGLVVPLYIVVIALFGGAISMTRRIPEIQKEAWLCLSNGGECEKTAEESSPPDYVNQIENVINPSDQSPAPHCSRGQGSPITLIYARERFIFQIMQVVSAPIVAMVAFQVIAPAGDGASMSIAFVSGFASEAVLLGIRRLSDLVGSATTPPATK